MFANSDLRNALDGLVNALNAVADVAPVEKDRRKLVSTELRALADQTENVASRLDTPTNRNVVAAHMFTLHAQLRLAVLAQQLAGVDEKLLARLTAAGDHAVDVTRAAVATHTPGSGGASADGDPFTTLQDYFNSLKSFGETDVAGAFAKSAAYLKTLVGDPSQVTADQFASLNDTWVKTVNAVVPDSPEDSAAGVISGLESIRSKAKRTYAYAFGMINNTTALADIELPGEAGAS